MKSLIDDTIMTTNPIDATSDINERLISGLTKSQFNIYGGFILSGDVFGTKMDLVIGSIKGAWEF